MIENSHHALGVQPIGRSGLLGGPGFRGRIEDVNRIGLAGIAVDYVDGIEVLGSEALSVCTIKGPEQRKKNQNWIQVGTEKNSRTTCGRHHGAGRDCIHQGKSQQNIPR